MSDEPFYSPLKNPPPPRQPKPGELLFEFVRASDHVHFRCELRVHGEWAVEAQFYRKGEFLIGRRFNLREHAVQWAEEIRKDYEKAATSDD